MRRNTAGQIVGAQLISKTDGSAVTSGTTTVYVTLDGGTQAAGSVGSGAATHEGNGYWTYAPAQAETNGALAAFTFVNTSACNTTVQIYTLAYDASGQVTGAQLAADQAVNVTKFGGTTVTGRDIGASVLLSSGTGAGQLSLSSGLVTLAAVTHTGAVIPTVSEVTGLTAANLDVAVSTRLASAGYTAPLDAAATRTAIGLASANLDTQLGAIAGYIDTEIGTLQTTATAIKAKTDNLPAAPAAVSDIPTAVQNADALLNRDMSAVSDTTARSPLNALRFLRNKWSISGTTLTVTKEDDTASAWTATVTATAGADPITGNDPA